MNKNEQRLTELKRMIDEGKTSDEICEWFEGLRIYFTNGLSRSELQERNEAIRRERFAGATQAALAEKYGLSYSQVKRIINQRN